MIVAWNGGGRYGLEGSPDHALALGNFIAAYAELEHTLAFSLSALCGAPEWMTWRMLSCVRNTSTKAEMVQSLVIFLEFDESQKVFNDFIAEFKSITKIRNRLMHLPYLQDDKSKTIHQVDHGRTNDKIGHVLTVNDILKLIERCRLASHSHVNWVIEASRSGLLTKLAQ